jgi:hypothetical protein
MVDHVEVVSAQTAQAFCDEHKKVGFYISFYLGDNNICYQGKIWIALSIVFFIGYLKYR